MIAPSKKVVSELSKMYTQIPVYEEIPLANYQVLTLYEQFRGPYTCLLEVVDDSKNRYGIIGLKTRQRFVSDGETSILYEKEETRISEDPLTFLGKYMKTSSYPCEKIPVFHGGAVGHFNYDMISLYEEIGSAQNSSLKLPMIQFMFLNEVLVLDYERKCITILVYIDGEKEYEYAQERILDIKNQIQRESKPTKKSQSKPHHVRSNMSKQAFMNMVKQAKQYIAEGEIFQVVLSQRFESDYEEDPLQAYAKLRKSGDSPYLYYLDFDTYVIAGKSPEMLLKSRDGDIQTMPIAGTRKRGKDIQEDEQLSRDLWQDHKENCEHMMLVDLARNDMGRVAQIGSVEVKELKHIKRYSHVMHMCTQVHARLAHPYNAYDALKALFPAGTLSGAPKIRAMQILNELEDTRREVYGGAIAFLSYHGEFDSCITIRTFLFHKKKVYIQAGAGIVKDSDPEKEYQETIQKGSALLEAIGCEVSL